MQALPRLHPACSAPSPARPPACVQARPGPLNLGSCRLAGVPEALSALTTLTSLDLSENEELAGGWQHLRPLRQLSALSLRGCRLAGVPAELSALTLLSSLDLRGNQGLVGGWQHLRPLRQLRALDTRFCSLAGVPQELFHLGSVIRI